MDLKSILPGIGKKDSPELYWTLIIEPDWVQAGIWRILEDKAQVVFFSPPTAWKLDEELLQTIDTALSVAIQNIPEDVKEPSKTVFGVISSWVSKGEIKQEHLEKIKRICSDLSLEPAGFVVLPEAIAHLIRSEEGSPLSAVVLGIYGQIIEISVFRLGNLEGTAQVSRSVSVVDDVVEGLTRFAHSGTLPSRFIVHDGKEGDLEEVRQSLHKADWDDVEKIKFLHPPKIEILNPEQKVNAVSLAGASEIADISFIQSAKEKNEETEVVEAKEEEIANVSPSPNAISAEDLGFVLGKDVVAAKKKKGKVASKVLEKEEEVGVVDQSGELPTDFKKTRKRKFFSVSKLAGFSFISKLKGKVANIFSRKQKKPKIRSSTGKKTLIIGGGIFALSLLAAFFLWWFYPKATVSVYVTTKKLNEKITISVDPDIDTLDSENNILPGEVLANSVSGGKTISTTGTKTVGEKAKGEVTLYRVGPELALPAGTLLKGPSDLEFSLDESIALASGSASTPGTTNAQITANDIGAQYNLASGSTFSINNYSLSDVEAKNEPSFSGGTSQEISAVSESDRDDLEEELTEELKEKAKKELVEKLASDKIFIEGSLIASVSSRTFSDKVGDEASTLKLSLSLEISAIAVDKAALTELARKSLEDRVPSGFVLRDEQIKTEFEFEEEIDGVYELTALIQINLLPEVNPEEVAKKIVGRYPALAKKYLADEVPGFVRVEVILRPKLPGRLGTLPRIAKNIEVEIVAEK